MSHAHAALLLVVLSVCLSGVVVALVDVFDVECVGREEFGDGSFDKRDVKV